MSKQGFVVAVALLVGMVCTPSAMGLVGDVDGDGYVDVSDLPNSFDGPVDDIMKWANG